MRRTGGDTARLQLPSIMQVETTAEAPPGSIKYVKLQVEVNQQHTQYGRGPWQDVTNCIFQTIHLCMLKC